MDATPVTFIYALLDPRTQVVRYVGKTNRTLKARLVAHCSTARRGSDHRANWIKNLLELGLRPTISLLEECQADTWPEAERFWIAHFKSMGCNLTNSTSGGDAQTEFSPEVKAKMSASATGRIVPKNIRSKISAGMKGIKNTVGRKQTPEEIAIRVAANTGKKRSPEARMRMSAAMKGKPHSKPGPETRAKLSAAHKGKPGWSKGKKLTDVQKAHLIGRKASTETRAKMSAAQMGRAGTMTGKHHTAETKAKISAALKRRHSNLPTDQLPLPL